MTAWVIAQLHAVPPDCRPSNVAPAPGFHGDETHRPRPERGNGWGLGAEEGHTSPAPVLDLQVKPVVARQNGKCGGLQGTEVAAFLVAYGQDGIGKLDAGGFDGHGIVAKVA